MPTSIAELTATITADTSDFESKIDAADAKLKQFGSEQVSGPDFSSAADDADRLGQSASEAGGHIDDLRSKLGASESAAGDLAEQYEGIGEGLQQAGGVMQSVAGIGQSFLSGAIDSA